MSSIFSLHPPAEGAISSLLIYPLSGCILYTETYESTAKGYTDERNKEKTEIGIQRTTAANKRTNPPDGSLRRTGKFLHGLPGSRRIQDVFVQASGTPEAYTGS